LTSVEPVRYSRKSWSVARDAPGPRVRVRIRTADRVRIGVRVRVRARARVRVRGRPRRTDRRLAVDALRQVGEGARGGGLHLAELGGGKVEKQVERAVGTHLQGQGQG